MSTETVLVSEVIFATRERLYEAWLDGEEHGAFTSESADLEPVVGGSYTTLSGYATGQLLTLEPNRRLVATWRTSEFPAGAPDSRLEVTFEDTLGGTLVTILHTGIPSGQSDRYRDGWLKRYLAPMKGYFGRETAPSAAPEIEPAALAPAPARKIGRAPAKPKTVAKTKPRPSVAAKATAPGGAGGKAKKGKRLAPPIVQKKTPSKTKKAQQAKKPSRAKKPVEKKGRKPAAVAKRAPRKAPPAKKTRKPAKRR